MKTSLGHYLFVLLACFGLMSAILNCAHGQHTKSSTTAESTTAQSAPNQSLPEHTVITLGNPPEGYIPPSEEVSRYLYFFGQLRAWNEVAKKEEDAGNTGWAEHWRTRLEKRSGLTAAEADQVKKIAFQYFQDDKSLRQRSMDADIQSGSPKLRHHNIGEKLVISPEASALMKEHYDLVNKAIAQLVTDLGSRSFSKLDLFTRHMDDQMKANLARQKAEEASKGGMK
jgi:hypothetical protein